MAKDFEELKKRVEFYVDDTLTEDTAILLFNACSEDISFLTAYSRTSEAEFDKEAPIISLPPDFLEPLEIKIKKEGYPDFLRILPIGLVQPQDVSTSQYLSSTDASTGYEIFGNAIEIRSSDMQNGTLLLRYYASLPEVTSLTDVPYLKPRFHDMYALYAAAKYYQNYQDELQAKNDYWGEYQMKRQELEKEFSRIKTKSQSNTVYQFRRWS